MRWSDYESPLGRLSLIAGLAHLREFRFPCTPAVLAGLRRRGARALLLRVLSGRRDVAVCAF